MWQHFHHQADIGIRGIGDTLAAAFEEGAMALTAVIAEPAKIEANKPIEIECTAEEKDLLFADWINALIYEMDVRKMLFSRFEVNIDRHALRAKAWGEPADPEKHEAAVEVKAATFMDLKVYQNKNNQWIAQCVVDV